MARPPKPADVTPSPRHKSRKKEASSPGKNAALDAVRALSNKQPSQEDFELLQEEADAEKNDRGYAILLAANLENVIQFAIERTMRVDDSQRKELFGTERSPIGTFSSKISIAQALRIFGNETRANLDIIRTIRNTFAHARLPLSFNDKEISDVCGFLNPPGIVRPDLSPQLSSAKVGADARELYRLACVNTSYNLVMIVRAGSQSIDLDSIKYPVDQAYEAWMKPKPLP